MSAAAPEMAAEEHSARRRRSRGRGRWFLWEEDELRYAYELAIKDGSTQRMSLGTTEGSLS
jgi:hypothetical protein